MFDSTALPPRKITDFFGAPLSRMAPDDIALVNMLARTRPSGTCDLLGRTISYAWQGPERPAPHSCDTVDLRIGETALQLTFERRLLEALLADKVDFAQSDGATRAMLCEHLATAWLTEQEAALSGIATVTCHWDETPNGCSPYAFRVTIDDAPEDLTVSLSGTAPCLTALCDRKPAVQPGPRLDDLPLEVCVATPPVLLPLPDRQILAPGDVLRLAETDQLTEALRLVVADQPFCAVSLINDQFYCGQALPLTPQQQKGTDMSHDQTHQRLNTMDVEVTAEFGQLKMTIAAVSGLAEGSVLDFGPVAPNDVKLRANGKVFAKGELLEIGDGVGLRVTQVF